MEPEKNQRIESQAQQERDAEIVEHNDQDAGAPDRAPEPKAATLDRREAIREAVAKHSTEAPTVESQPTKAEIKTAVDDEIEPPNGFSAEAKEAWRNKDYKRVNQEYLRLDTLRTAEVTRAQNSENTAKKEARTWRDLGEKIKPYIEARGLEGVPPETAMMEAIDLVSAFRQTDPATAKAELKKLGIDLDAPAGTKSAPLDHPEIKTLQETVSALVKEREDRIQGETVNLFTQSISQLASLKTRTGDPAYPGFQDGSEAGIQFARELGSLTREPWFRTTVLRRIPNATHVDLVREAYIQLGGKVAGDPVRVSQSNQEHIQRARRAASSTPGRPTSSRASSAQIGKLDRRGAIRAAIAEHSGGR